MIINVQTPEDGMQRQILHRQMLARDQVVRTRQSENVLAGETVCPNCRGTLTFSHGSDADAGEGEAFGGLPLLFWSSEQAEVYAGKIAATCTTVGCVDFVDG